MGGETAVWRATPDERVEFALGYDDFAWMRRDKDLAVLHDDARFLELMA